MRKQFQKIISYLLCIIMVFAMIPIASAGEASDIYIGDMGLNVGEYYEQGVTSTTTEKPEDNYAYLTKVDGVFVLTLHNFEYSGTGYEYPSGSFSGLLCTDTLIVNLEGTNKLEVTASSKYDLTCGITIYPLGSGTKNLIINGDDEATIDIVAKNGIYAKHDVEITGGTINIHAEESGLNSGEGYVNIDGGVINVTESLTGIHSNYDLNITGGDIDITSSYCGIDIQGDLNISGGSLVVKSMLTGVEDDIACAISSAGVLNIDSVMTVIASEENTGTPEDVFDMANIEKYDYIKIYNAPVPDAYVGGVGMFVGDYLEKDAIAITTTKPADNYAYLEEVDGELVLTLHNYEYSGIGYEFVIDNFAGIFSKKSLKLNLEGTNKLEVLNPSVFTYGIVVDSFSTDVANFTIVGTETDSIEITSLYGIHNEGNITFSGGKVDVKTDDTSIYSIGDIEITDGKLSVDSKVCGISAESNVTIDGGEITVKSEGDAIYPKGDFIMNSGNLDMECSNYGVYPNGDIYVNGGTLVARSMTTGENDGDFSALYTLGDFIIDPSLAIIASKENTGTPEEDYDRTYLLQYDYIKIYTAPVPDAYVGGVGMFVGDYLEKDAIATTTTKPADNYAYLEEVDGELVLTLHNYEYSGEGFGFLSNNNAGIISAEPLEIVLEGSNKLEVSVADPNCFTFGIVVESFSSSTPGLVISGTETDSLEITAVCGMCVRGDITIDGGIIDIKSVEHSIYSMSNVEIKDGTISLEAGIHGIFADMNVTINGGNTTIKSDSDGIYPKADFTLNNGTLEIESMEYGMYPDGDININGGILIVRSMASDVDDDNYCSLNTMGTLSIDSSLTVVSSEENTGTPEAMFDVANLEKYDYIKIEKVIPEYTITFHSNDGKNLTTTISGKEGETITLIDNPFTREGYFFGSWNNKQDLTGHPCAEGAKITLTGTNAKNHDFYASWIKPIGTVEFTLNGYVLDAEMKDITVSENNPDLLIPTGDYGITYGVYSDKDEYPDIDAGALNGKFETDTAYWFAVVVDGNLEGLILEDISIDVGSEEILIYDEAKFMVCFKLPELTAHVCTLTPVEKVEPDCTNSGKEAYYHCSDCLKNFEDESGTIEIADIDTWGVLEVLDHTSSDWMHDAENHWKECTVEGCDAIIEDSKGVHVDSDDDGKCDVCAYEKPVQPVEIIMGDVNGDGKVTMEDVVMLQKAIAKLLELNDSEKLVADVNYDEKTTMEDVVLIQKYIAKLISSFDKK